MLKVSYPFFFPYVWYESSLVVKNIESIVISCMLYNCMTWTKENSFLSLLYIVLSLVINHVIDIEVGDWVCS